MELVWAAAPGSVLAPRERMLPSVSAHLVIRLGGKPLRLFSDAADLAGALVSHAIVGGVRDAAYLKDSSDPVPTVGVVFRPGAAGAFFGAPADRFAGCHTPLDVFWGSEAERLRAHLMETPGLAARLVILEHALMRRLPRIGGVDPAIVRAALLLQRRRPVGTVAAALDWSHRHFILRFSEAIGLSPKRYARLFRFGQALQQLERPAADLARIAQDAGYADQAHFNRDFRSFAGISPGAYRKAGGMGRHVPQGRR